MTTVAQTVKVVNGRLSATTDSIDADILEVSPDAGNQLQVKENGLYVVGVSLQDVRNEIATNLIVRGSGIITNTSSNGTAIGKGSSVLAHSNTVAVGGSSRCTNSESTAIGYDARADSNSCVSVGYRAWTANSGSTALGRSANTGSYLYAMALGVEATVTGGYQNQIGSSGTTTYCYGAVQDRSDVRDKTDIQDCELGLDFINALRPVKYRWDYREDYYNALPDEQKSEEARKNFFANPVKDGSKTRVRYHHGLIAQEFKQTLDSLGIDHAAYQDHSQNGGLDVRSIGYTELIPNLIKAIQELTARVKELENS